jgi:GT2 family glycosyltransferase
LFESPQAVVVQADALSVLDWGELLCSAAFFEQQTTERLCLLKGGGLINPTGTCVRREAFERLGGFDPSLRYAEDWHLWLRLSLLGQFVASPGEPVRVNRAASLDGGESPHVDEMVPNYVRYQARALELFLHRDGGRSAIAKSLWRPRLSRLWYKAGRKDWRRGRRLEAADAFRRFLQSQPLSPKGWWWYGLSSMTAGGQKAQAVSSNVSAIP